jgi:HAD superfamily hydrolase (TIGR01509 family)
VKPIKFLLLDAGGVLVSERGIIEHLIGAVATQCALDAELIWNFWKARVRIPLWTGKISIQESVDLLNKAFDTRVSGFIRQDVELLPWAREALELMSKDQVGILSNHRSEWLQPCLNQVKTQLWSFNVLVSDAIGYAKPDVSAYRYAFDICEHADEPGDILFVDNKQENVDAAIAFGMRALLADERGEWVAAARRMIGEANR